MTQCVSGEFDPESMNPYNAIDGSEIQSQPHRDLAIKAASMTFTLLKNDNNVLPLKGKVAKLAVSDRRMFICFLTTDTAVFYSVRTVLIADNSKTHLRSRAAIVT